MYVITLFGVAVKRLIRIPVPSSVLEEWSWHPARSKSYRSYLFSNDLRVDIAQRSLFASLLVGRESGCERVLLKKVFNFFPGLENGPLLVRVSLFHRVQDSMVQIVGCV